ncbi:glycine/D-amino acid oxidase-like deaminating enzyme/nitrite reductase/ring-hydroxylating ferredoxin subunit [Methanolinea mesophila]|uniref:FAD-dependent oxidoreductase n=1 Tax=Methanolinea mesophila TaxID=547055 RepID=UPI001AE30596|nr:FAD-dependent oxidoreductase [Methanolinea mesophila]MBP1929634.1 glycine/D-amino acid oxidase-like deaminating enzyme/nitrite reductase/ring-hydroxylating ferredoxin subunit [Methanolinea mesophila]
MSDDTEHCTELPGMAESYWIATSEKTAFPPLAGDGRVDVTVLGGGIAGVTAAYLLKHSGFTVALVEAGRIVSGTTGYTTAKLTSLHRLIYGHLVDSFGSSKARQYADANQNAIEKVGDLVRELSIDCGFVRKPAYTYAESESSRPGVEREADTAKVLGLPARFVEEIPLPVESHGAVRVDNQAQFHPRKYLLGLAARIPGNGSHIFENTRALDLTEIKDYVKVTTAGGDLESDAVVLATHYPVFDRPGTYFSRLSPSRSYAIGARIDDPFPEGMFINAAGTVHSWRSHRDSGKELVIVTGEEHPTGSVTDTRANYRGLEAYARTVYDVRWIDYHWSAQDYFTPDRVPYIGQIAEGHERIFVATGFNKWGMTAGTAAAMILTDLVSGRSSPWAEVFSPSRFEAGELPEGGLEEFLKAAGGEIETPSGPYYKELASVPNGEGSVIKIGEKKVAIYKDAAGNEHTLDPTCMHMGCRVRWNNAEGSWDCPCHGSRYNPEGQVIEGPTVRDLVKMKIKRR